MLSGLEHALPQDEVHVALLLVRKAMRMFIWERTAPWPMSFWVGRWVPATRVTAGARPSRAIVSACLSAAGACSGRAAITRSPSGSWSWA